MVLFDNELEPGHQGLKPCPGCGEQEVGRRQDPDSSRSEYYCAACGIEPAEADVQMSLFEALGSSWESAKQEMAEEREPPIGDPELRQRVEDKQAEGWETEEIADSGERVVLTRTKGGTIGGHALTGVLTGLWSFGLGNAAYGKLSKKRNEERLVLRADDERSAPTAESEQADPIERIRELKRLTDDGLLTDSEFEEKKRELLDDV